MKCDKKIILFLLNECIKLMQALCIYTGKSITKKVVKGNVQGKKTIQGKLYKHGRDYERKTHWTFLLRYSTLTNSLFELGDMKNIMDFGNWGQLQLIGDLTNALQHLKWSKITWSKFLIVPGA